MFSGDHNKRGDDGLGDILLKSNPFDDGPNQRHRIERCRGASTTGQWLMDMIPLACPGQNLRHGYRVRHKLGRFESRHRFAIGSRCSESKLALMGLDQVYITVSQHLDNASFVPGERGCRVFVDKEPSSIQLQLVQTHHELKVHPSFLNKFTNTLGIHFGIVHMPIPSTVCSAWRRSHNEVRFELAHKVACQFPIILLGEIPRSSIGFGCPEVQGTKSSNIQIASTLIGLSANRATTIDFHECGLIGRNQILGLQAGNLGLNTAQGQHVNKMRNRGFGFVISR